MRRPFQRIRVLFTFVGPCILELGPFGFSAAAALTSCGAGLFSAPLAIGSGTAATLLGVAPALLLLLLASLFA